MLLKGVLKVLGTVINKVVITAISKSKKALLLTMAYNQLTSMFAKTEIAKTINAEESTDKEIIEEIKDSLKKDKAEPKP